jgi:hypothetical protein
MKEQSFLVKMTSCITAMEYNGQVSLELVLREFRALKEHQEMLVEFKVLKVSKVFKVL